MNRNYLPIFLAYTITLVRCPSLRHLKSVLQALQGWGWTMLPLSSVFGGSLAGMGLDNAPAFLCFPGSGSGLIEEYRTVSKRLDLRLEPCLESVSEHPTRLSEWSQIVSKLEIFCYFVAGNPLLPFCKLSFTFLTPGLLIGLSLLDPPQSSDYGFLWTFYRRLPYSCTRGDHVMTELISQAKVPCYIEITEQP